MIESFKFYVLPLFLLLALGAQSVHAVSNVDMYRTLRAVESTMGAGKKFDEINVFTKKDAKQSFYYLYSGAATSTGKYTQYSLVTTMENKGGHIEIVSYSRRVPKKFQNALASNLDDRFNTIKEDMADHGYSVEFIPLEEQWVSVAQVSHGNFTSSSFWSFFVELGQFHGSITGGIYTFEREYEEEITDRNWQKVGKVVEMSLDDQVIEMDGEAVFEDLIFFNLQEDDKDEFGQWSWFRKDEYLIEVKLRGASFEYAIHVDILDSLPSSQKDALVKKLEEEASANLPSGFSKAVVTINDLVSQGARVAFVYEFAGRDGDDIKDDAKDYREEQDELYETFRKIAETYDGIGVKTYSNEDFLQLITEQSFDLDETKTVMGKGYWELFDFQDVIFYVINYPDMMVLSTSAIFTDEWAIEELIENNNAFKSQLKPEEYLYADNVDVTFHPDDEREVWIRLEFKYASKSTKELFDIYEVFFIDRIGRNLNSKLLVAQGAEGLGPEAEE